MRHGRWRVATFLAVVITLGPVAGTAQATDSGDDGSNTHTHSSCRLYPIGLSGSVLAAAGAGSVLGDITSTLPGQEGWLTWNGDVSEPALERSLTPPGNDDSYVNPYNRTDHVLSVGDWVSARPGAVSSSGVRHTLDKLLHRSIVVPVWDTTRGTGRNFVYHVHGFAEVEILSYDLGHDNKITAKYHGPTTCGTPEKPPIAQPAEGSTSEDRPTTIVVTGSTAVTGADLTFRLGVPGSGSVVLTGQPTCTSAKTDSTHTVSSYGAAHKADSADHEGDGHDGGGDDTMSVTCSQTLTYTPAPDFFGRDTFTFTVFDPHASSAPATVSMLVSDVNDPPTAGPDSLSVPGNAPYQLATESLLANDSPGPANEADQILTVKTVAAGTGAHGTVTLTDRTVTYVPDAGFSGAASFSYSVCDNGTTDGQPDSRCADGLVSLVVSPVADHPPVGDAQSLGVAEDGSLPLTLTGSDPDGDRLVFAVGSGPEHGSLSGTAPDLTYTPAPDYFGPDAFTFTVSDAFAESAPATVSIAVSEVNDPPVAGADSVSVTGGVLSQFSTASLLANDTPGPLNESGQVLALTAVAGGADTHGTVSLVAATVTYVPDPGFSGLASFTYTVCDDGTTNAQPDPKCTSTGAVTVNVGAPNQPPVADAQSVTGAEDTSLPLTLSGSDPDGDPITYATDAPAHGSLSGTAPNLTYTPAPDYFGTDAFTFTTHDAQAASVPATVTIDVTEVNDPPATGADSVLVPGGKPFGVTARSLIVNDTVGPSNEATQTLIIPSAQPDANTHGTVTMTHGTVTYVPDVGFSGAASFSYTACDNGTTAGLPDPKCANGLVSVVVTAVADQPPVGDTQSVRVAEDGSLPLTLTGSDPDGDPVVFAVGSAPAHGSLSGTAPDLTYTPAPDYFGPDSFTFTGFDGQAQSVPATVSIVVSEVNDPPVAGADSLLVPGGRSFGVNASLFLANDTPGPLNESDQLLAVTAVSGGADTHGTVSLVAGTVTYAPEAGFFGPASFTYTVCDNGTTDAQPDPKCTNSGTVNVNVTAPNDPPVADAQSVTVAEDTSAPLTLSGSDPEGDPITYAAVSPAHGSLSGTAPNLTYTPAPDYFGPDAFTFTTHDALSASLPATVTINVTEVNDPPVLGADFATLGGAGTLPPPPAPNCGTPCGVIYGDPHLMSFDGALYDAQAVGEVIAAKSTTDDFELQARFTAVPQSRIVSIATGVAMRVAGHRVSLYRTQTGYDARIDGNLVTIKPNPQPLPGGGTIGTYGDTTAIIVVWPDGSVAIVHAVGIYREYYRFTVELGLAPGRLGRTIGLLGDADGNKNNDLVTRGGQPVTFPNTPFAELYGTYINSWRILQAESLFDYGPGETTATFTDLTFPDAPATPQNLPAGARTSATTVCGLFGLTTPAVSDACIVDVGLTGDGDFANSAAAAQTAGLGIPSNTGGTDIGSMTTVSTSTPGENAVRTFPGTAGQKLTLSVSDNTYTSVTLTVAGPTGQFVTSLSASTATAFRDVFTLPVTGTYTITVDPAQLLTGSLTFLLASVPDNTGTTAIGTPTSVSTSTVGENAVRTFPGTAGQKLTLSVLTSSYTSVTLTVAGPTGQFVTSLSASTATAFRDVFTLPVTGTYTITVDPAQLLTGSLTFLLASVPDNTGTTAIGTPTSVSTSTVGENAVRTFPGTAGQKLTLSVLTSSYTSVTLTVAGPTGQFVTSLSASTATAFRDVFTLPVTGTYTITVDPAQLLTGSLTFLLASVPDNTGTTAIGTPTSVSTSTVGENAVRTFPGTAGQKLTLSVSGNTYSSVTLTVAGPTGQFVTSLSASTATAFRDVFTLPVTGTYTITVDPAQLLTGSLTFLLASVPDNTGTTAIGTPTSVSTSTVGENAVRTFPGTAGQKLTLSVSGNTYSSVTLTVAGPTGQFVTSLSASTATAFRDVFTLPVTGTYTITVDPSGQFTGSLTFLLAEVVSGAAQSLTAGGSGARVGRLAVAPPRIGRSASALGVVAQGDGPTLAIPVAALLENDRPGPLNESTQSLTVTKVTTGPSTHGTATLAAGIVAYTPDPDFAGSASLTYTACDDGTTAGQPDPRCSDATLTIKVTANHPPTVDPQTVTTTEDASVPVTLTGTDADGDPVVFAIATAPSRGAFSGTLPHLTYTPAPDANGVDTFTFTANDGHDQSTPATVTINVSAVNDPPVPQSDTVTSGVGTPVTVPVSFLTANDDAGPFNESGQALTVTAVTPGSETHGAVAFTAGGVTYNPDAGFTGTGVVGYTVCDNGTTNGLPDARCADSTLSIHLNRPPTASDQTAQTSRTAPVPFTLSATDPEGDALDYAITAPPQHGVLSGTAPTVTYTANAGFIGNDSFSFTAADAFATSNTATVSIAVNDVPAPALHPDSASVVLPASVLVDVLANDTAGTGTMDASTLTVASTPTHGTVAIEAGRIRYTPNAGTVGSDTFSYSACDTAGGCGTAVVTISVTENHPPTAAADNYDIAVGATLHPAAPGVLANDTDPDAGDKLQARLVRGVTNGTLLLNSTGAFTYTPNGPGVDTFVYHVTDPSGAVSNDATVTIVVTGPPGPPNVGNDLYKVQQGTVLDVAAPGVLEDDFSPNPRLALTVLIRRDAAQGMLLLHPDGSFTYTPRAGYAGIDQFSYVVRDSEGRVSQEANVGITVSAGGPATAVVGATSPAAGARLTGPTHFTATLTPPAGESVASWTVSYRRPGDATLAPLANGSGPAVAADFDPTTLRNGTYSLVIRAVTSGGGVLVSETGVSVEGDYKPGRYATTYHDVAVNSANIPIDLYRTYDNTDKTAGDFGVGWSLQLAQFRVDTNGPLGGGGWSTFTCGSFPFLAACYTSPVPHFVTVTWPDGHLERFRFAPNQGSQLLPSITTAGFVAEPGTTSTLAPADGRLLLSGSDFLLGDFFSADGIYDPGQFVLTDSSGTKYLLDRRAGLLGITDRNGNTVSIGGDGVSASSGMAFGFTRDADNRITRIAAPGGNIDYSYSPVGDLVGVQYPNGTTQAFTYDAHHNLLTTSGDGQVVRTLHYDSAGRVIAVTDGNGNTANVSIDVAGHQQVVTDATGQLTTVNTYDGRGDLLQQDRTAGGKTLTTRATYDSVGRVLTNTDGLGHTASQTYDAAGDVLTKTDANGKTTTSTFNAFGEPLTIADPLGHVTTNKYDTNGDLIETDAPDGGRTTSTYDAAGRVLTTTDPVGRVTTLTYDGAGQLSTVTDSGGNTTHQIVDAASGRVLSVTDPKGATTSFSYDADGNVTGITDANGSTTSATYDAFDRVTSRTDATGASVHQTYDAAGNLKSFADRNGQTITYSYDLESRLVTKTVPGAGTTVYTYDAFGRRLSAANDAARLAYTYDDADRLLTSTSTPTTPNALPTTTFTYSYDADGNVVTTQGPAGTTGYTYDGELRLATLTDPAGGVFNIGRDAVGRQISMNRPNGVNDTVAYDAAGGLATLHSTLGATLINQADYAYNSAGLRSSLTTTVGTSNYTYDGTSQLTSASQPPSSPLAGEQYTYDAVGNRSSTVSSPLGSFAYDIADRMLSDATQTYTYDKEGDLLSRTVKATGAKTIYTWTAEHRLIGITNPDSTTSIFLRDPVGRVVEVDDGASTSRYGYDGQAISAEYDKTNTLVATYVHDPTEPTRTFEMTRGGQRYFYLTDGLGSTTALTTIAGVIANTYQYDSFGASAQTGTVANPFTYTGQLFDKAAGLLLFPLRAYDPVAGRFLSEDPIASINPYVYLANDATNGVDPSGGQAATEESILEARNIGAASGCVFAAITGRHSLRQAGWACLFGAIVGGAGGFAAAGMPTQFARGAWFIAYGSIATYGAEKVSELAE